MSARLRTPGFSIGHLEDAKLAALHELLVSGAPKDRGLGLELLSTLAKERPAVFMDYLYWRGWREVEHSGMGVLLQYRLQVEVRLQSPQLGEELRARLLDCSILIPSTDCFFLNPISVQRIIRMIEGKEKDLAFSLLDLCLIRPHRASGVSP